MYRDTTLKFLTGMFDRRQTQQKAAGYVWGGLMGILSMEVGAALIRNALKINVLNHGKFLRILS
jgi:hypothetical protein